MWSVCKIIDRTEKVETTLPPSLIKLDDPESYGKWIDAECASGNAVDVSFGIRVGRCIRLLVFEWSSHRTGGFNA